MQGDEDSPLEFDERSANRREVGEAWIRSTRYFHRNRLHYTPEETAATDIVRIDSMMIRLAKSTKPLFTIGSVHKNGSRRIKSSKLGSEFLACLSRDYETARRMFPRHTFTPYFELFTEKAARLSPQNYPFAPDTIEEYNRVASELRAEAKKDAFCKEVENRNRSANKNAVTARRFLAYVYRRCSNPLFVRFDTHYHRWHHGMSAESIRSHRGALLAHLRRKYPSLLGYVWTSEYGRIRGPHGHILVALNGHKVRTDQRIGRHLVEHWSDVASNGTGWGHNCNAHKLKYERLHILGIGHVHRDDHLKRANLVRAITYLAKRDLYAKLAMPGIKKTFGTSYIPKPGKPSKLKRTGRKKRAAKPATDPTSSAAPEGGSGSGPREIASSALNQTLQSS